MFKREAKIMLLIAMGPLILALLISLIIPRFFMPRASVEKVLIEGFGVDNLEVGKSIVNDVVGTYGEPAFIQKTKAEYSRNYIYPKLGLRINFHDDKLNTISSLPNFKGKTSQGISLESSLEDIERTYGEPDVATSKTKYTAKAWAYPKCGVIILFKKSLSKETFPGIDKIVIYKDQLGLKSVYRSAIEGIKNGP
jgi:hypothetical protein